MLNNASAALIGDLVRLVWEGVVLGIAYGLISMSAIQFIKDFYFRESFNRNAFYRWFKEMQGSAHAEEQLIWLSAAGDGRALFSLTIDKMAGQIAVAATTILEAPRKYSELLGVLAFSKEFEKTFEIREDRRLEPLADDGSQLADLNLLITTSLENLGVDTPESRALRIQYADARTRVGHRIQRQIDLLQLRTTQRWVRTNQLLSFTVATFIGFLPLFLRGWLSQQYGIFRLTSILPISISLSLLGGWFAPILRDVIAHQSKAD
jgi:hypothetical protein